MRKQIWVIKREWLRNIETKLRTLYKWLLKIEAINIATKKAREDKYELKISRDWEIRRWNTYWWDPFPPRDRIVYL